MTPRKSEPRAPGERRAASERTIIGISADHMSYCVIIGLSTVSPVSAEPPPAPPLDDEPLRCHHCGDADADIVGRDRDSWMRPGAVLCDRCFGRLEAPEGRLP